jgi:hypothetical protein
MEVTKTDLALMIFKALDSMLQAKSITKTEFSKMSQTKRNMKALPVSYRTYRYLGLGQLVLGGEMLQTVCNCLNIPLKVETKTVLSIDYKPNGTPTTSPL